MASSTQEQLHFPNPYGATAAPPPTPSSQPTPLSSSSDSAAADILSRLLHRLPPTLSLPTRRSPHPAPTSITPPVISLSDPNPTELLSSFQLGSFQLINHSIPAQLAQSAESESLSLFDLPRDQKQLRFPQNWPVGYDDDDGDDESFCLDSSGFTELSMASLRDFSREMERAGLGVVEALSCALGIENPAREDPSQVCSLMWISEDTPSNKPVISGKTYPYVVGLHYQIRCQKYSLLADSGWVSVSPQVDSVLVTLGDISQVWSNGKLKKVRGRPIPGVGGDLNGSNNQRCITMSLLVTLPLDTTVSPILIPRIKDDLVVGEENEDHNNKDDGDNSEDGKKKEEEEEEEERVFSSFSFEDYAWRVYHERLHLKDPLDRYRL